ncbi:hypothetical protein ACQCVP_04875 [Rossellomorea vietnamensis]|uniref:hypothetical protein n=1 Tax=Rossellomorea vietnamensis TaxID=218284 RepID=UPI003CF5442A
MRKNALFPFIPLRLFDPEGLGAGTRLGSHLSRRRSHTFRSNPVTLMGGSKGGIKNNNIFEKSPKKIRDDV